MDENKLIEGKEMSRETAFIWGRSANGSNLQFGKFNSVEEVLEKMCQVLTCHFYKADTFLMAILCINVNTKVK